MLNNEENNNSEPNDVSTIKIMLREAGIIDYDPTVIHQLLYFMDNHITNILENAMAFSEHAKKSETDNSDILLALKIQRENEVTPIPRNVNTEISSEKNNVPLPEIKQQDGIRLPPERYCLTNANYKLKIQPKENPVVMPKQQFIQNAPYMINAPAGKNVPYVITTPASAGKNASYMITSASANKNPSYMITAPATANKNVPYMISASATAGKSAPYVIPAPACNDNNSSVLKKSKLLNIPEQKIVFRPSLKINIKQAENEYQIIKKQRTN